MPSETLKEFCKYIDTG